MQPVYTEFEAFAADPRSWPAEGAPEIAFAGRSNVGKSSLLNALAGRRGLARVSATPGRTRGLVFFRVEPPGGPNLRFVDLPGYGYARASKRERAAWRPLIERYVERRATLCLLLLLIDARRGAQAEERALVDWLAALGRPAQVVLTKIDHIARTRRAEALHKVARELALARPALAFSAREPGFVEDIWRVLIDAVGAADRGRD